MFKLSSTTKNSVVEQGVVRCVFGGTRPTGTFVEPRRNHVSPTQGERPDEPYHRTHLYVEPGDPSTLICDWWGKRKTHFVVPGPFGGGDTSEGERGDWGREEKGRVVDRRATLVSSSPVSGVSLKLRPETGSIHLSTTLGPGPDKLGLGGKRVGILPLSESTEDPIHLSSPYYVPS